MTPLLTPSSHKTDYWPNSQTLNLPYVSTCTSSQNLHFKKEASYIRNITLFKRNLTKSEINCNMRMFLAMNHLERALCYNVNRWCFSFLRNYVYTLSGTQDQNNTYKCYRSCRSQCRLPVTTLWRLFELSGVQSRTASPGFPLKTSVFNTHW